MFEKLKTIAQNTQFLLNKSANCETRSSTFNKEIAKVLYLRKGMWVSTPNGVGILTDLFDDGAGVVMLVNDDGTDRLPLTVNGLSLKQARFDQIPLPRRPPSSLAVKLGYK